jgi:excisionase family DNA binding protein
MAEVAVVGPFLGYDEAGTFVGGVPRRTMRLFVQERLLPAYKVGRRVVFAQRDLEEFVTRNRVKVEVALSVSAGA